MKIFTGDEAYNFQKALWGYAYFKGYDWKYRPRVETGETFGWNIYEPTDEERWSGILDIKDFQFILFPRDFNFLSSKCKADEEQALIEKGLISKDETVTWASSFLNTVEWLRNDEITMFFEYDLSVHRVDMEMKIIGANDTTNEPLIYIKHLCKKVTVEFKNGDEDELVVTLMLLLSGEKNDFS